jgi:hypothetical protein
MCSARTATFVYKRARGLRADHSRRYIGWRATATQLIYDPCAPEWLIDSQSSLVTLERPVIPHLNLVVGVEGRSDT